MRKILISAVTMMLMVGAGLTSAGANATSSGAKNEAPSAAAMSHPTWKTWHCGKSTGIAKPYGKYQCKRWVRYDYCGSSRPLRLNQVTKMSGLMYVQYGNFDIPVLEDIVSGRDLDQYGFSHVWKKSSTGKKRNMYIGQQSRYLYVITTSKPNAKPTLTCDHP